MLFLGVLFAFIAKYILTPIRCWLSAGHNLPVSGPGRTPPDLDLFPNYIQNKKGLWLHWRYWASTDGKAPKGVIMMLHGLGEHHGRYEGTAAYFNAKGYAIYMCESTGHGSSEGIRKYAEDFTDLIEEQQQFLAAVVQPAVGSQHGGVPLFLFGHSMGGLLAVHVSSRVPQAFQAVIISGAALKVDPKIVPEYLIVLSSLLSAYLPKLVVTDVDGSKISRNTQVVDAYGQDPCVPHVGVRARFGYGLLLAQKKVSAFSSSYKCPILIMHSSQDTLTMPEGSSEFHSQIASTDKTLRMYDQYWHEMLNEGKLDRSKVRADMLHFLDSRL